MLHRARESALALTGRCPSAGLRFLLLNCRCGLGMRAGHLLGFFTRVWEGVVGRLFVECIYIASERAGIVNATSMSALSLCDVQVENLVLCRPRPSLLRLMPASNTNLYITISAVSLARFQQRRQRSLLALSHGRLTPLEVYGHTPSHGADKTTASVSTLVLHWEPPQSAGEGISHSPLAALDGFASILRIRLGAYSRRHRPQCVVRRPRGVERRALARQGRVRRLLACCGHRGWCCAFFFAPEGRRARMCPASRVQFGRHHNHRPILEKATRYSISQHFS